MVVRTLGVELNKVNDGRVSMAVDVPGAVESGAVAVDGPVESGPAVAEDPLQGVLSGPKVELEDH